MVILKESDSRKLRKEEVKEGEERESGRDYMD